jgi:hypothetical protein
MRPRALADLGALLHRSNLQVESATCSTKPIGGKQDRSTGSGWVPRPSRAGKEYVNVSCFRRLDGPMARLADSRSKGLRRPSSPSLPPLPSGQFETCEALCDTEGVCTDRGNKSRTARRGHRGC